MNYNKNNNNNGNNNGNNNNNNGNFMKFKRRKLNDPRYITYIIFFN